MNRSAIALFFLILALSFLASSSALAVVYVKWDSSGPVLDGDSWETAYHTIQQGLNDANATKEEIWIAKGTYYERIALKLGVALYGGFAGTETDLSQRNWITNQTVIDGQSAGSVVTAPRGATETTRIDGFTIRNGNAEYGGGIYCDTSSPMIANNAITGNRARSGGGIYCYRSSPMIAKNRIAWNSASFYGGGIYCYVWSSPAITDNSISANSGSYDGGGICCHVYSSPTITNNRITGNGTTYDGGGIYCDRSSPTITNNTLTANSAGYSCGGIYCYSSTANVCNNVIAFNSSGILAKEGSSHLRNNCVYANASYDYSGISPGTGDISADPLLANNAYGNLHVQPESPCINAGWNEVPGLPGADMDGQPRIQDGAVDIGADESDGTAWDPGPYVIVRVRPTGDDGNDGSTWELAKRTIQSGVDAASAVGGDVWVKAGTYRQRTLVRPYAYLYGGFAGTENARCERQSSLNKTVLDGDGAGSVLTAMCGFRVGAIDGFTIQNGNGNGGGIYCLYASPTISNNTVMGNAGQYCGAGIYCAGSSPVITKNIIRGNSALYWGGGIACWASSAVIANNRIAGNSASYPGGGIYCAYSSPVIANNTISDNSAPDGGGICSASWSPTVLNNIVAFNSSGLCAEWGTPVFHHNCVYGNASYNYSGLSPGTGDISADPLLRDLVNGDYHLFPDSPCIDWGTNEGAPEVDMDGNPRPVDGDCDGVSVADIGAYEYQPIGVQVDVLPGNPGNTIRLGPNKTIPVAVLSTAEFDARLIDPMSVVFGPGRATEMHGRGHWEDVNLDGRTDLLLHFPCAQSGIAPGDTSVTLYGRLVNREWITGSDGVRVLIR